MSHPTVRRIALPAAVGAVLLSCGTTGAHAAAPPERVNLEEVVNSLNESGGLYIHPGVSDLSDSQLDRLRGPLERARLPVYLAIFPKGTLPARATAFNRLIVDIHQGVGRKGTYAVVVGDELRAYSWALSPRTTVAVWKRAKKSGGTSMVGRLSAFAQGAGTAQPGKPGPGPNVGSERPITVPREEPDNESVEPKPTASPSDGMPTALLAGGGAAVVLAAGGAFLLYRRRGRGRPAQATAGAPAPGQAPAAQGTPGQGPVGPGRPTDTPPTETGR